MKRINQHPKRDYLWSTLLFCGVTILLLSSTVHTKATGSNTILGIIAAPDTIVNGDSPDEVMPRFPGGEKALLNYLGKNIRYPSEALEKQIEGKVIIGFYINEKGKIMDPKIVQSLDPKCDKEAIRVIKRMPKWEPGMKNGRPVNTFYTVPITFSLGEHKKAPKDLKKQVMQRAYREQQNEKAIRVAEKMPEFPGGEKALFRYIDKNVKYPKKAAQRYITGRVTIEFIIDETGNVLEPIVIKSLLPECDMEAYRVVKAMPKWKPGEDKGKKVPVYITLSIQFKP